MAAIFPALSHVLYFAVPSSRSSAPLSPFCAALVQDHDDPGAVAISPAMIRSCASTISNSKCSPDYPWLQWPQPSLAGPPLWVFLLTASSQDSGSVPKPLTLLKKVPQLFFFFFFSFLLPSSSFFALPTLSHIIINLIVSIALRTQPPAATRQTTPTDKDKTDSRRKGETASRSQTIVLPSCCCI